MFISTLFQPAISLVENWMAFDDLETAIMHSRHHLFDKTEDAFIVIYGLKALSGQVAGCIYWSGTGHGIMSSETVPSWIGDRAENFGRKTDWRTDGF
jgi:hypothetical protein